MRIVLSVAAVALAAACARGAASPESRDAAGAVVLSIVATNDLHGALLERDGRGGLAMFAGYLNNLRAARARDGGVLLVDAGDMFQGTVESNLAEGAPVVAAYNALGYSAAAIGNHEFDFGVVGPGVAPAGSSGDRRGALKARAAEATFPFLAANLIDTATGKPVSWPNVRPSALVDVAGVSVGLLGVMTIDALSATIATAVGGLRVTSLAPTIAAEAQALRQQGAEIVVAVSHAGGRCTRFDSPQDLSTCDVSESEIVGVVRALPRGTVDLIASGHTHAGMAHEVDGTILMQAFSRGVAFSRADITVDRRTNQVVAKRVFPPQDICARVYEGTTRCDAATAGGRPLVPAVYEGQPVAADAVVARVIAPAVQRAKAHAGEPVGVTLDTPIRVALVGTESPLGNLFTDAMLAAIPGADLAINNTRGGLRADLPRGPLTYGRLYEAFPFDNRLVKFELSGADLRRVFETQLRESRALPGIAGLRVAATCRNGAIATAMTLASGRTVGDGDRLVVVTTDFLATGGSRLLTPVMPPGGFALDDGMPVVRDVVAEWLEDRGGRLRESQLISTVRPRWSYRGTLPMRC